MADERYPRDWDNISKAMRERGNDCCEWCGVPNRIKGLRGKDSVFRTLEELDALSETELWDTYKLTLDLFHYAYKPRLTKIVLTCAHVFDPEPMNCDPRNLASLCQRCHLSHDLPYHIANRQRNLLLAKQAKQPSLFFEVPPLVQKTVSHFVALRYRPYEMVYEGAEIFILDRPAYKFAQFRLDVVGGTALTGWNDGGIWFKVDTRHPSGNPVVMAFDKKANCFMPHLVSPFIVTATRTQAEASALYDQALQVQHG